MLKLWFHSDIPVFSLSKYQEVLKGYCPSSTSPIFLYSYIPLHPMLMPVGKTVQLEEKLDILKIGMSNMGLVFNRSVFLFDHEIICLVKDVLQV